MKFINKKMVLVINRIAVELSGGKYTSPNNLIPGKSLSFVENIHTNEFFGQKIFNTIYEQAAAYLFYISKNHLFYDGNKRTALAVACTFLEWNDKKIVALNEDEVFDFVTKVAESENNPDIQIPIIASWLERMVL